MIEALYQRGVICRSVTYEGTDIICFAPPLIINEKQLGILGTIGRCYFPCSKTPGNMNQSDPL
ncbi:hypothetical protein P5G51_005865 [Virgibacillus sp. 179-BFC.A HS]|uniref:IclR-ED domain-containing protein n=1 Tax=Tigheibacillus jepli TaxID=3035914 RepID=A0ABU5CFJ4_9BACI|nr:hypothetical protein [Virgibacillus sp. 179-BFC.A HS]MDY0404990.1 hypothetical protein [Virgibacillus sp. 179-BFC.A HS]